MDNVEVKIKGMVITSRYGTLQSGTLLRTDAAFARHLVHECNAAEYVGQAPAEEASAVAPQQASQAAPEQSGAFRRAVRKLLK